MRSLAKPPMPTWLPSISTVVVPSGEEAVMIPWAPGITEEPSRKSSRPSVNSSSSVMRGDYEPLAHLDLGQCLGWGGLVGGTRDGVAVGAGGGIVEHPHHGLLHQGGDDVLPLASLGVGVGPRQAQHLGKEHLGQTVAAHHPLGQVHSVGRQFDRPALEGNQALGLQAVDHLRHRRTGHLQPLGYPGLDDVDVVFGQLEDGLAILLERRVPLGGLVLGHDWEFIGLGAGVFRPTGCGRVFPRASWACRRSG